MRVDVPVIASQRLARLGGAIALVIFVSLAVGVATDDPRIAAMDLAAANWMHPWLAPATTAVMLATTALGSPSFVLTACVLLGIWLTYRRRWSSLIVLCLCVPGGMLVNVTVKQLLHRARPRIDPVITIPTFSFPSGHTLASTLFFGLLAVYGFRCCAYGPSRVAMLVAATLIVLAIAASRIYLGVHYLSDVTAGAMEGLVWLVLCVTTADRRLPAWVPSRSSP